MPLGVKHNSLEVWEEIEQRFCRRLALWKIHYISKGGRLALIKSTLSNLPIYIMSLFRLPRRVKSRLEKIQRDFLRSKGNLEKKIHLVSWDTVCLNKKNGGLGIHSLSILNRALLRKWIWRFSMEVNSPWRHLLSIKYGMEDRGWFPKFPRGIYEVGL